MKELKTAENNLNKVQPKATTFFPLVKKFPNETKTVEIDGNKISSFRSIETK